MNMTVREEKKTTTTEKHVTHNLNICSISIYFALYLCESGHTVNPKKEEKEVERMGENI